MSGLAKQTVAPSSRAKASQGDLEHRTVTAIASDAKRSNLPPIRA
jgi:hypothetical protein